jgi:serine/threonine protein phosphatase 1
MSTIYAVGDIHGELEKLRRLIRMITSDSATRGGEKLGIFLGDYIDRGLESKGTIELLSSERALPFPYLCLGGNHEHMALTDRPLWLYNGGRETLYSYGGEISDEHLAWMKARPLLHREGKWFFVHAGIDPLRPLDAQNPNVLLWTRDKEFMQREESFEDGVTVVHGHTPNLEGPEVKDNRINLDTGACFGGRLTCAILTDRLEGFLHA